MQRNKYKFVPLNTSFLPGENVVGLSFYSFILSCKKRIHIHSRPQCLFIYFHLILFPKGSELKNSSKNYVPSQHADLSLVVPLLGIILRNCVLRWFPTLVANNTSGK